MKMVKVKIRHGGASESQMVYPARYRAQEVDRAGTGPLAYSGAIGRGGGEEFCIIGLENGLADVYARDPNMEIISADETDRLMDQWRKDNGLPLEYVSDPNRIQAILAKKAMGIEFSEEDRKAMDPDDDCPGLSKRVCDIRKRMAKGGQTISDK